MQTSSVAKENKKNALTISFDTEQDRIKGFGILTRSNFGFKGIGKNKFLIKREHYELLISRNIRFKEIK
jgi:hypothetical protein